jgi:hypothetical protein
MKSLLEVGEKLNDKEGEECLCGRPRAYAELRNF